MATSLKLNCSNEIVRPETLQSELTSVFASVSGIMVDNSGLTVFYTGMAPSIGTVTQLQTVVDNYSNAAVKQDLYISGDTVIGGHVSVAAGIDAGAQRITNVDWPVDVLDAANKGYVDRVLSGRFPFIFGTAVPVSTTSTDYVTVFNGAVPEANVYRVYLACTYSSTNVIAVRLSVGGVSLGEIIVHTIDGERHAWNQLFDNVTVAAIGTPATIEVRSVFPHYVSTVHACSMEFITWHDAAATLPAVINTTRNTIVSATGDDDTTYVTWSVPALVEGTYRLSAQFEYGGDNIYTNTVFLDDLPVNTFIDHVDAYERKVSSFFIDTYSATGDHAVIMKFGGKGLRTTFAAFIELDYLG